MQTTIRYLHAATTPPPPTPPPTPATLSLTPQQVHPLFPFTPLANIAANLPAILAALAAANLADPAMVLMALATIAAEADSFLPLTEQPSPFNTSPGGAPGTLSSSSFDLYDHRADLGNLGPPDGANFRGRGFVQLTGRFNYAHYAPLIGQPLLTNPALAATPAVAAALLARFLLDKEPLIRRALAVPAPAGPDLALARRLVNGGSNGLDRFTACYTAGSRLFA